MDEVDGTPVEVRRPRAAQGLGISFVHQRFALVPQLSIAENVFFGRHPYRHIGLPVAKWGYMRDLHRNTAISMLRLYEARVLFAPHLAGRNPQYADQAYRHISAATCAVAISACFLFPKQKSTSFSLAVDIGRDLLLRHERIALAPSGGHHWNPQ